MKIEHDFPTKKQNKKHKTNEIPPNLVISSMAGNNYPVVQ
jgi:hypothetical protein